MSAIRAVVLLLAVALAALGVLVWRSLAPVPTAPAVTDVATAVDAAGNPVAGDGTAQPTPSFLGGGDANHMVRYEMPKGKRTPPLPAGAVDVSWSDLWADGKTVVPDRGERIGTPDKTLFPEGSTDRDVKDFFLDIGDMRAMQPPDGAIKPALDGKRVRLAGFTTPVGFGEDETRFLLVPELGACIHVPPPPPNQIVYVPTSSPVPEMFAAVWVTGTLRADPVATILADVGYRLEDVATEPYD